VQLALKTIGQYRGKLDGCFSEDVKKCIQHVQLQHGKQPADGELTIEFFRLLADLVSRAHQHSLDSKSSEMDTSPPKATLVGPPGVEATSDVAVAIEVLQLVIKMITEQFQSVPTQLVRRYSAVLCSYIANVCVLLEPAWISAQQSIRKTISCNNTQPKQLSFADFTPTRL
jgi:hypothetical protein